MHLSISHFSILDPTKFWEIQYSEKVKCHKIRFLQLSMKISMKLHHGKYGLIDFFLNIIWIKWIKYRKYLSLHSLQGRTINTHTHPTLEDPVKSCWNSFGFFPPVIILKDCVDWECLKILTRWKSSKSLMYYIVLSIKHEMIVVMSN